MTHWTDIPSGLLNTAQLRFWGSLGDNAGEVALKMRDDPAFVTWLASYACQELFEPSTSQKKAREIMGTNMFGIEDAIKHFGVNPSKAQLAALGEVPFSEETLEACKATHVLVAVFPMSILDVRAKVKSELWQAFYNQDWYNKEAFAKEKGEIGWQLVRKTPVENSTSKNWSDQQALLSKDDETPKAQVVVYTIIGHFLATGESLFEKVWVNCSDLDSDGYRVIVGHFDAKGLHVYNWGDDRHEQLGLASARK